jgi:hypothetical protein
MRCLRFATTCVALLASALAGCGGGDSPPPALSRSSNAVASAPEPGPTPFIASVGVNGTKFDQVTSVNFTIKPLAGTVSRPVSVTYSAAYLARRGFVQPTHVQLPLFGLYPGVQNLVTLTLTFSDDSKLALPLSVTTPAFDDPTYAAPQVVVPRAPGVSLGFDFVYMKSLLGSPVIVDTDGHPRWIAAGITGAQSSTFQDGIFILGSTSSPTITLLALDGSTTTTTLDAPGVADFHHDMEAGKTGVIDNVDVQVDGVSELESIAQEITPDGHVITQWDLGGILADAMRAGGDDPTPFVRPGTDWFHMNTAIYDPADDSVVVSSRENFVIKLDYATGAIRWIFGDPTKYWYTFPSLRAKSLAFLGDGLVPVGQHSITIAPDGNLLLFNNGAPSFNQPAGAPAGQSRTYSAVSSYVLDEAGMTATEAWHFDYGQQIYSPFCSSTQQFADGSVLLDYATAEGDTAMRLVGLAGAQHQVVFDYRYANQGCNTAWNSQPIHLESLAID